MDWIQELSGVLGRYQDASASNAPDTAHQDFDQVAQSAPPAAIADGLAAAFRSDETPPFGQMLGQLFGNSQPSQRADILNSLLRTVGPGLLAQILARYGAADASPGGQGQITPQAAQKVPPQAVQELAEDAEKKDPSIVERISHAYAAQPEIVKTLGKAALAIAMAQMLRKQYAGR
jgi:hypothetical protein